MHLPNTYPKNEQYSLGKILGIWALSALPMGFLAYWVTPWVAAKTGWTLLIVYWWAIIAGLIWQFILSLIILRSEKCPFNRTMIAERLQFQKPVHPKTGKRSYRLLLWTLPFIALSICLQSGLLPLPDVDGWLKLSGNRLPVYDLSSLATGAYKGAWWLLLPFGITFVFNYFLGEELIYRGILLPRMNGVFGKWDWLFNGILFGLYHLHKPQVIVSTAIYFGFVFAFPAKRFQSIWMSVIIHGLEGILGLILVLGVILGWN